MIDQIVSLRAAETSTFTARRTEGFRSRRSYILSFGDYSGILEHTYIAANHNCCGVANTNQWCMSATPQAWVPFHRWMRKHLKEHQPPLWCACKLHHPWVLFCKNSCSITSFKRMAVPHRCLGLSLNTIIMYMWPDLRKGIFKPSYFYNY